MAEDIVRNFGFLTLGSRMKRIGEALQSDTQRIVDSFALPIQPNQYPLLAALDREGSLTIGELAQTVGISQPGVTRAIGLLADQGLLSVASSVDDQRRRVATLTDEGRKLVAFSKQTVWPRIEAAVRDLCSDLTGPLLDQLAGIEKGLAASPLSARAEARPAVATLDHPLDRPIWSALTSTHGRFSRGGALACRYAPGLIPFVAIGTDDPSSVAAIAELIEPGETLHVVQRDSIPAIPGAETVGSARLVQMACEQMVPAVPHDDIERLSQADAEEMLALASLTKPGPFSLRAAELGDFWGVKIDGRLAAMAGTRMAVPGFTELSGVCTHPDFQGRGLGRRLSMFVTRTFMERGETPFLHAYEANEKAIGLYETIGFRIRQRLNMASLRRAVAQAVSGA